METIDLDQLTVLLARGASRSPEAHAEYHRHLRFLLGADAPRKEVDQKG